MTSSREPVVSVLMPALDATQTIEAAIESVFADERVPAEILVIDDGSSDGTLDMIEKMDDERVKLLHTGGHRLGANAGRNVGLDARREVSGSPSSILTTPGSPAGCRNYSAWQTRPAPAG